ncbi:hypothetical protein NLJ89_g6183 [Agrocybe chaxingu]|uniref:F-box domain-containing protein n=1 Tax=Agrocybe chaxingu TaxID=84603 RepID=A0A9W8JWY7_9AGAR|nr:hypothetical protein NLJ89_g6183 [Agrocybe chaxingu]
MNYVHDPMHKLPPEIVSRVFTFCMLATWENRRPHDPLFNPVPRATIPPLLFGAVCQRWREIAWSTPQLWTKLNIYLDPSICGWQTKVAQEWLARSGSLHLSIHLRPRHQLDLSYHTNLFAPLMRLLSEHSPRWKHLDVDLPHSFMAHLRGDLHGIPVLHTMFIDDRYGSRLGGRGGGSLHFGQEASSLVSVKIYSYHFRSIGIGWQHVTTVHLSDLSIGECLELFQVASSLRECDISLATQAGGTELSTPHHIISYGLEKLAIDFMNTADGSALMNNITLPCLQSLSYSDSAVDPLPSFLSRSSSKLTHLHLSDSGASEVMLIQLLNSTPFLQSLDLYHSDLENRLLDHLVSTVLSTIDHEGNKHGFLPHLAELCLGSGNYSLDTFPMIFAPGQPLPNQGTRPWKKMEISFLVDPEEEYLGQDLLNKLLEIVDRGIELLLFNTETDNDLIKVSQRYYESLDNEDGEEDDDDGSNVEDKNTSEEEYPEGEEDQ